MEAADVFFLRTVTRRSVAAAIFLPRAESGTLLPGSRRSLPAAACGEKRRAPFAAALSARRDFGEKFLIEITYIWGGLDTIEISRPTRLKRGISE